MLLNFIINTVLAWLEFLPGIRSVIQGLSRPIVLTGLLGSYFAVSSQTISTSPIASGPFCAGASINVGYSSGSTFTAGNVFKVQLATDASFTSFIDLAPTYSTTASSGTLNNVIIPSNTATGTTYRIRIVSSAPAITGSNNGSDISITATTLSAPSFTGTSFCQNNTFNITFTKTCNFYNTPSNNVFSAELSDEFGVFPATPTVIGTLTSVNAGTITATIPGGTPAGTGYRIRIKSSNPVITGPDNGTNLTIVSPPGDPAVFGNGVWNVYAYTSNNFTNYAGFYTENNLNFNTTTRWGVATSPSNADGSSGLAYSGCAIIFNVPYSFIHKRTNFACGYYQIDIPTHDDNVTLIINGSTVYTAACCVSNLNNVWTGFLNGSSTVEVRTQNTATNSNQSLTISNAPNPLTTSPPPTICSGSSATLSVSSSSTATLDYTWSPGGLTGSSVTVSPTTSTTYTITGTDPATGCTVTTTLPVTVTAAGSTPTITTTTTQATICSGVSTTTITATGANTYTWSASPSDPTIAYLNANQSAIAINPSGTPPGPTTYTYTVTGNNGCTTNTATRNITVQNIPAAPATTTFGNGTWNVYAYNGTAINSSSYYGYYTEANLSFNTTARWAANTAPSSAVAVSGPPASQGYTGCTVSIPWAMSFKRTGIPCGYYQIDMPTHDNNLSLLIDGMQVYSTGYTNTAISNIWTGFIGPGTTVEFQLVNTGGPGNLSVNFTASPNSPFNVSSPITVCPSPSNQITLVADSPSYPNATYLWTNGNASNNGTINSPSNSTTFAYPNVSDAYTATMTDAGKTGCTASLGVPVTVNPVPTTAVAPTSASTTCPGTPFTLTASGANSYTWSANPPGATAGMSATTGYQITASPTVTTTYTVSGGTNCPPPLDASVTITVNPIPDYTTFPSTTWNVYGFNSQTIGTNYVGYYTDNGTTSGANTYSFNTLNRWANGASPSTTNATGGTGWSGCAMNATNISLSFKRTGFACGIYQLDVPGHDDDYLLFINGVQVAQHVGCCDSHTNVWTGALSPSSTVEWQLKQGIGGSYLQVTFTKVATTQNVWLGGASTDWFAASNWCNGVPTSTTDVLIPSAGPQFMPVIGAAGAVGRAITINAASAPSPAASLTISGSNTLDVYGNWVNNGSFTANTSRVTFLGTNSTLSSASPETFYDVVVNKTASNTLTISSGSQRIANSMTFTQGIVKQNGILEFLNASTAIGANNASYVDGLVTKTGTNAFTFPVGVPTGTPSLYRPIGISGSASATDSYTAQYSNSSILGTHPNTNRDATLDHVSGVEYWVLNRINGSSGTRVTLSWDTNSGGVGNLSSLRVAGWNAQWRDYGNGSTSGNTTTGTVTSAVTPLITSYGTFTLGTADNNNALPIHLLSFNCLLNADGTVSLNWKTATELNSDYFLVERADEGSQFSTLAKLKAAGTSKTEINYSSQDEHPYFGKTYYRLREVDFDGTENYSEVCFVLNDRLNEYAYPNPANAEVSINLKGEQVSSVSVSNTMGVVLKVPVKISQSKVTVTTASLPDGIYIVQMVLNKQSFRYRIVVKH